MIAEIRGNYQEMNHMEFYCSGPMYKRYKNTIPEGVVTDRVKKILAKHGFKPVY